MLSFFVPHTLRYNFISLCYLGVLYLFPKKCGRVVSWPLRLLGKPPLSYYFMLKSNHIIVDLSVYTSNSVVQLLSHVWFFTTPRTAALQTSVLHCFPKFAQTHVHWVSDAIQPSHPLSSPSPPALNLSQHQGLFQRVGSLHEVAKVLSFSFSISPSSEYSVSIFFRVDWFDLHATVSTGAKQWKIKQFLACYI